jgi:hypothetical protein
VFSLQVLYYSYMLNVTHACCSQDGSGEIEFNEFKAMIDSMIEEYGPGATQPVKSSTQTPHTLRPSIVHLQDPKPSTQYPQICIANL